MPRAAFSQRNLPEINAGESGRMLIGLKEIASYMQLSYTKTWKLFHQEDLPALRRYDNKIISHTKWLDTYKEAWGTVYAGVEM